MQNLKTDHVWTWVDPDPRPSVRTDIVSGDGDK